MATQTTLAHASEPTPLADYLSGILNGLPALQAVEVDLTRAAGHVLAAGVFATTALPAFDQVTIDGYAARSEDLLGASPLRPARLAVVDDVGARDSRSVRLAPGTCVSVAAGAPLPAAADVVIPPAFTDRGMVSVEVREQPRRGYGVRRVGEELEPGALVAAAGSPITPAMVAVLVATGVAYVSVRPSPRVAILSTGDELVAAGRQSRPGQIVDANSHAMAAATLGAGARAYRVGVCADDPEALRGALNEQVGQADLVVITGGTGGGPGDVVRRMLGRDSSVVFTETSLFPRGFVGYGTASPGLPVICLPGDPGTALIGFEVVARPVIQKLAGAESVFRPSARATLLETLQSPFGLREFRPAHVSERRGGGYTVQALPGGPYTLSGMAMANALIVLGERIGKAAAGSTVDVLLLERR
jgi:molybdopterin molybdotransferase